MIGTRRLEQGFTYASGIAARILRPSVVFIGDSITEFWSVEDRWLFRPVRLNAGIAGQTSGQMRARFAADVVARHPRVAHIMGGTNDLWFGEPGAGGSGTIENIAAMVAMAQAAGIAVILAPPPPIGRIAEPLFSHMSDAAPLRAAIVDLARETGCILVDYAVPLCRDGDLHPPFTTDGVHLTRGGYHVLRPFAEAAIRSALAGALSRDRARNAG